MTADLLYVFFVFAIFSNLVFILCYIQGGISAKFPSAI